MFQHVEMVNAPAGDRQAQPGVATGHSVRLGGWVMQRSFNGKTTSTNPFWRASSIWTLVQPKRIGALSPVV